MRNRLPYIMSRFNQPLLLTEEKAQTLWAVIANKIDGNLLDDNEKAEIEARHGHNNASDLCQRVVDGVAIIQIVGSLVHRGSWIGASSGLVSYQGITEQFEAAENDTSINSIIFEFDSGGGEVGGLAELANKIRSSSKRTIAIANSMAASAAFYLSAACDEIHVTETGSVGSIGVVIVHQEISKKLEMDGVKVTAIYAGKDKVAGASFSPLSDDKKQSYQADVDQIYQQFTSFVAEGIELDQDQIIATEARMFMGKKAVEAKLALSVTTVDQLITKLTTEQPLSSGATKETNMSDPNAENAPNTDSISKAEHDAAVKAASDEAATKAEANATKRIGDILGCDEAKGREKQANHLAFKTAMSADDAKSLLGASAKETAPAAQASLTPLQHEMAKDENQPNISAENNDGGEDGGNSGTLASRYSKRHTLKGVK